MKNVVIFLLIISGSLSANANPYFYQGRLLDSSRNPIVADNIRLFVMIKSQMLSSCVLFLEQHNVNTLSSNGLFSIPLTKGSNQTFHSGILPSELWTKESTSSCLSESGGTLGVTSSGTFNLGLHRGIRIGVSRVNIDNSITSTEWFPEEGISTVPIAQASKTADLANVAKLIQVPMAPTPGQLLRWDGSQWTASPEKSFVPGSGIQIHGDTISVDPSGLNISNLADGSVTTSKLADGAVTNSKISSVEASKIAGVLALTNIPLLDIGMIPNFADYTKFPAPLNGVGCVDGQVLARGSGNWICQNVSDASVQGWAKVAPDPVFSVSGSALTLSSRIPASLSNPSSAEHGRALRWNNSTNQWEWFLPTADLNFRAANGSASSPSYSFIGDADTGIFLADPDQIAFSVAGNLQMQLNSKGLGINTSSPRSNVSLDVNGAAGSRSNVIDTGASVDLRRANNHLLKNVGSSTISLLHPSDGAVYTLVIADSISRTYTFTGCANSYFNPSNGPTNGRSSYTIMFIQDHANLDCYINWSTGFE